MYIPTLNVCTYVCSKCTSLCGICMFTCEPYTWTHEHAFQKLWRQFFGLLFISTHLGFMGNNVVTTFIYGPIHCVETPPIIDGTLHPPPPPPPRHQKRSNTLVSCGVGSLLHHVCMCMQRTACMCVYMCLSYIMCACACNVQLVCVYYCMCVCICTVCLYVCMGGDGGYYWTP